MSDDRFTYIHLRSEVSLWSYVDDQVDWAIENLEDRIDQSAWDMIPPYQNEDDEGILPSHSHPSYPFGNPYDMNHIPQQAPQLCPVINQPLAVGSALLVNNFNNDPGQSYWSELATERLLERTDASWSYATEEIPPGDMGVDQTEQQHHPADSTQQQYAGVRTQMTGLQTDMRTPAADEYQPPRLTTMDVTETFQSDEEDLSLESGPMTA